MVIVSRHGAQLAFVGIFCGLARARLERNQVTAHISSTARADMVDAASNTAANEKQRGETMPEGPDSKTGVGILLPEIGGLVAPKSH